MIPLQPKKPAPTIAKPQVSRPPSEQPRTAPLTTSVSRPPSGPIPKTPLVSRPPTSPTGPTVLPTQVSRPPAPVKSSVPQPGQPKFMGEAPAAMKKGGYVTKDGRLNLGSSRVSTATKNKKSPNF